MHTAPDGGAITGWAPASGVVCGCGSASFAMAASKGAATPTLPQTVMSVTTEMSRSESALT